MAHFLVVANRTLLGGHVLDVLRERVHEGDTVHVVVPASPPHDHAWTEAECRRSAQLRLEEGLGRLQEAGMQATGTVGDANPVFAVIDATFAAGQRFDEIIVSTLPPGVSRWLSQNTVRRMRRRFPNTPVTHVVAEPALAH